MKKIDLPDFCLVLLVGPSGSGKTTFAHKHFRATEVLSSDFFRGLVSDDEDDQAATEDAFDVLHYVLRKRLAQRKLCVVDATNIRPEDRKPLLALAREYHALVAAFVFALPDKVCHARNRERENRGFGEHVVRRQARTMKRHLRGLPREGFRFVHVLSTENDVNDVVVERIPLWVDKRHESGPFDIIGDIHGCYDELVALLNELGYVPSEGDHWKHPDGRRVIFLGDLVDRGPKVADTLRLVMAMVAEGDALCVPGNHEVKLLKYLRGRDVTMKHGLQRSVDSLEKDSAEFRQQVQEFIDGLVSHFVLDSGRLVVAHAGLKEEYQGRASGRVREFALYGDTTGEVDELGLPVRNDWAAEYRGRAMVVYGHTPMLEPEWVNHTINIDTGCVIGGRLTALRYPEKSLASVPAKEVYATSAKGFRSLSGKRISAQQNEDDILDLGGE